MTSYTTTSCGTAVPGRESGHAPVRERRRSGAQTGAGAETTSLDRYATYTKSDIGVGHPVDQEITPVGSADSEMLAVTQSALDGLSVRWERRAEREQVRRVLRELSSMERVVKCGSVPFRHVGLAVDLSKPIGGRVAGFRGLTTCGSIWVCPRCSAAIGAQRADEVRRALREHRRRGGYASFLTLTMSHRLGEELRELWSDMSAAWSRFTGMMPWRQLKRAGMTGYIRATEVTVSSSTGWHVHYHVILLFGGDDPGRAQLDSLVAQESLVDSWRVSVRRVGRFAGELAQSLSTVDLDSMMVPGSQEKGDLAAYLTKATRWDAADELARGSVKLGRNGSRTPFEMLRDIAFPDDPEADDHPDLELWHEWEESSYGRRQMTWSRGLKRSLGIVEVADDEIAADTPVGAEDSPVEASVQEIAGFELSTWLAQGLSARSRFLEEVRRVAEAMPASEVRPMLAATAEAYGVRMVVDSTAWRDLQEVQEQPVLKHLSVGGQFDPFARYGKRRSRRQHERIVRRIRLLNLFPK